MEYEKSVKFLAEIDEMVERLQPQQIEADSFPCPNCSTPVYFPRIAREADIEAMSGLLQIVQRYCAENGVMDKILAEIFEKIAQARRLKHMRIVK